MMILLLFHGFQVSRGRMSVCLTMRYREGSRVRCGGVCRLGGGALMAVRARVRVQGEATVYRDPFTLSRFSSVPRSGECMPHDAVSRRFTNALRGRLPSRRRRADGGPRTRASAGGGRCL